MSSTYVGGYWQYFLYSLYIIGVNAFSSLSESNCVIANIIEPSKTAHWFINLFNSFSFILYLFNIQVQQNGKTLTYGEIQVLLNNFLALEEAKLKTKKQPKVHN